MSSLPELGPNTTMGEMLMILRDLIAMNPDPRTADLASHQFEIMFLELNELEGILKHSDVDPQDLKQIFSDKPHKE